MSSFHVPAQRLHTIHHDACGQTHRTTKQQAILKCCTQVGAPGQHDDIQAEHQVQPTSHLQSEGPPAGANSRPRQHEPRASASSTSHLDARLVAVFGQRPVHDAHAQSAVIESARHSRSGSLDSGGAGPSGRSRASGRHTLHQQHGVEEEEGRDVVSLLPPSSLQDLLQSNPGIPKTIQVNTDAPSRLFAPAQTVICHCKASHVLLRVSVAGAPVVMP